MAQLADAAERERAAGAAAEREQAGEAAQRPASASNAEMSFGEQGAADWPCMPAPLLPGEPALPCPAPTCKGGAGMAGGNGVPPACCDRCAPCWHAATADPSWVEQRLMQHCVELLRAGTQPSLPLLGSFCQGTLGLQMRVRLPACMLVAMREGQWNGSVPAVWSTHAAGCLCRGAASPHRP